MPSSSIITPNARLSRPGGIGEHGILDLLDAVRGIVPCLVHEVRVGAYRIYFHAEAFEVLVLVSHIFQFGRTYESEVGGIEEEYRPLAEHVLVGHGLEFTVVIGLYFEFGNVRVDY